MATSKFQGVCSVCLRPMQLHGDRPIRHGFSAIGVRQGAHGGYHTGPCGGSSFPHLGISIAGTMWAIGIARQQLEYTDHAIRELAKHPDLIWYPTLYNVRGRPPDTAHPVTLRYGEDVPYSGDGRPTYANEHNRRVATQDARKTELERTIAAYDKVIATWQPSAAAAAPAKIETVHLAKEITSPRFGNWTGICCRGTRPGRATTQLKKTADPAQVTCKRCKAALGLP